MSELWRKIDEEARRRFEAAWLSGQPRPVEEVIAGVADDVRLATLEELVCIELEMASRTGSLPPIQEFTRRFPELNDPPILSRLQQEHEGLSARAGDLRRSEPIGEGGMGVVWRATDPVLGREVALKELRDFARSHPELRRRFLDEARITAGLAHPGIVPVYQLVEDGEAPYYTMKLVDGQTLTQAAAQATGPLQQRRLLQALLSVLRTVAFAHARGVLHRDLKPDNILLGAYGETVVLDWGLARAKPTADVRTPTDPAQTQAGALMGTPAYMSPELCSGQPASPASDQYALGAVMYELLAGQPPFGGTDADAVLDAVRDCPPPSPRSIAPAPVELEAICLKAMARVATARYRSVDALAEDLERYLADEPTDAWPEPWTRKLQRWSRRHRTAVGIGLTGLGLTSVALSVGFVAKERADAREARRITALRQSVEVAQAQARADLHAGRYAEARDRLGDALQVVEDEPGLHGSAPELLERATALAAFVQDADAADQAAFLGFDGEAAPLSERALQHLAVFDHADWWFEVGVGLPAAREDELQWSVWHQLNLLASLIAADHCEPARAIARHASNFRPSPVSDRAKACERRDPCLVDQSGNYWTQLEAARCSESAPTVVREGVGHALRARAALAGDVDHRDAFGDQQAAKDLNGAEAEVHWITADGLAGVEGLWATETARAYGRAMELELEVPLARSPAAIERLERRLIRARAFADETLDSDLRQSQDGAALLQRLAHFELSKIPTLKAVPAPERIPVDTPPARLPLLNGGFELGLARHWGRGMYESERPIWWNSKSARSTAEVVTDEVHSGSRALRVVHETPPGPHMFGTTTQAVPAEKGARYRLSAWGKHHGSEDFPSGHFVLDRAWNLQGPRIGEAPEWTRFSFEFVAEADTIDVRFVTIAPVELWLDDITLERI